MYNCNLLPIVRDKELNAMAVIVIPGKTPADYLDSFLYLLVEELLELDAGITRTLDAYIGQYFTMRAHLLVITGDRPAIASIIGTKTLGAAKRACRLYNIEGVTISGRGQSYYFPHGQDKLVPRPVPNLAKTMRHIES